MATLATEHCVPSQKDDPRLTPDEIASLLPQLPGWTFIEDDGDDRLE
ncbi:MAG: 4a-hydroxytetrahydrobiopterin dehydratase, partial [Chloroflexia bacterium]|nr:4a-hydroxytetrahydrobiopterin dehydratase [Chloroflexia bacterium]